MYMSICIFIYIHMYVLHVVPGRLRSSQVLGRLWSWHVCASQVLSVKVHSSVKLHATISYNIRLDTSFFVQLSCLYSSFSLFELSLVPNFIFGSRPISHAQSRQMIWTSASEGFWRLVGVAIQFFELVISHPRIVPGRLVSPQFISRRKRLLTYIQTKVIICLAFRG